MQALCTFYKWLFSNPTAVPYHSSLKIETVGLPIQASKVILHYKEIQNHFIQKYFKTCRKKWYISTIQSYYVTESAKWPYLLMYVTLPEYWLLWVDFSTFPTFSCMLSFIIFIDFGCIAFLWLYLCKTKEHTFLRYIFCSLQKFRLLIGRYRFANSEKSIRITSNVPIIIIQY